MRNTTCMPACANNGAVVRPLVKAVAEYATARRADLRAIELDVSVAGIRGFNDTDNRRREWAGVIVEPYLIAPNPQLVQNCNFAPIRLGRSAFLRDAHHPKANACVSTRQSSRQRSCPIFYQCE